MLQTSLLRLGQNLFAKAEYENPTGSVKDRAALFMLLAAEEQGCLLPGGTVIEPTSGNMGIALAALCRNKGYRCVIVMPDSMSVERQRMMASFGAQVVLTPGVLGMADSVKKARELAQSIPNSFLPGQFENEANVLAHYRTTGPEIWAQTGGRIDIFVAGVGTGGTITGTGRFLKEQNPDISIFAVEPVESPLLSQGRAGSHGIQGIGANFIPDILDRSLLRDVLTVTSEDAIAVAKRLKNAGISAGANVYAAQILASQYPDKTIVTILPDSADRYASLGI